MQVSVDGQKIDKYIIGSFHGVKLPLEGISVNNGNLTVIFEDRYLNKRETMFTSTGLSDFRPSDVSTSIYPNPATDILNIVLKAVNAGEYSLQIFDMSGRAYFNETFHPSQAEETIIPVNIEFLKGGVYHVRVSRNRELISNTTFIKY